MSFDGPGNVVCIGTCVSEESALNSAVTQTQVVESFVEKHTGVCLSGVVVNLRRIDEGCATSCRCVRLGVIGKNLSECPNAAYRIDNTTEQARSWYWNLALGSVGNLNVTSRNEATYCFICELISEFSKQLVAIQ